MVLSPKRPIHPTRRKPRKKKRKTFHYSSSEGELWWFGHVESDRIAKRVYVGECAGSRSVGMLWWKRWINTMKESLRKRGLDVRQVRRMGL